jgi:predicted nucleic acid-binding protein
MIVVDANVAAKWYLPEIGSEATLELMDGPNRLFAPDLIRLEVLGSITRCVRTGEAGLDETRKRCGDWFRHLGAGAVTLIPEADLLDDALSLALEIKHNLQDCLYLAAARRLDASLITADKKFRYRASSLDKRVSLLAGCERN